MNMTILPSTRPSATMMILLVVGSLAGCRKAPVETRPVTDQTPVKPATTPAVAPPVQPASNSPVPEQPGKSADLMKMLDNAPWIADGPDSAQHIYVIGAPWCGVCKYLYKTTRGINGKVQFRWIESGARDAKGENLIALAATARDSAALDAIYGGASTSVPKLPHDLQSNVFRYVYWLDQKLPEVIGKMAYPTLIWMQSDGVHVKVGVPDSIESVIEAVAPRPEAASIQPSGAEMVKMRFQHQPISGSYFATADGVKAYCLPDENAPVEETYKKDYGFWPVSRVQSNGQTWIEVKHWQDTLEGGVFIREQDLRQP